jgi:hypothetical protein
MARTAKMHPALKHGGYATGLLPGEDAAAFERLHRELITEFKPLGALEADTVLTMARLIWRKQNLGTFRAAKLARDRYLAIENRLMPADYPGEVNVNFARREEAMRLIEAQARKELGDNFALVEMGEVATLDHLAKELAVEDRLDTMFDRCVKRLLFLRGFKSVALKSECALPLLEKPIREVAGSDDSVVIPLGTDARTDSRG